MHPKEPTLMILNLQPPVTTSCLCLFVAEAKFSYHLLLKDIYTHGFYTYYKNCQNLRYLFIFWANWAPFLSMLKMISAKSIAL